MSASLVGSEMCIRDRTRPEPPPEKETAGECFLRVRVPAPSTPGCLPLGCLLYTSDAADDM
eukprot:6633566-Alexandrium_andersonii.AAC.1